MGTWSVRSIRADMKGQEKHPSFDWAETCKPKRRAAGSLWFGLATVYASSAPFHTLAFSEPYAYPLLINAIRNEQYATLK